MTEPTNLTAEEHNQLTELIDKQQIAETSSDAKVAEKAKTAAATISAELEKRVAKREAATENSTRSPKTVANDPVAEAAAKKVEADARAKDAAAGTTPPAKAEPIGTCKPLNGKRFQVGEPTRPGEGRDAWVAGAKKRAEVETARKKITGEK